MQERIPGVALCVAWKYLSAQEKTSFKDQARRVLQALCTIKPSDAAQGGTPGYLVADPDPVTNRGIQTLEREILFGPHEGDARDNSPITLMHNDLSASNLIVDRGTIVGVIDWEMAGWFGWETIKEVCLRIRSPAPGMYDHLDLPQQSLDDIYFWNDLYD